MPVRHLVVVLASLVSALAGCGEETGAAPRADPATLTAAPTAGSLDPDVRLVAEEDAQLLLWVSNQSFVDDPVRITVTVDGVQVVDQDFDVEGQHNWLLFPLALPGGPHEIAVVSGTGARLERTFRTRADEPRHAVVNYWNYEDDDGRFLDWMIQDDPVAFA